MTKNVFITILLAIGLHFVMAILLGLPVMLLWNWVVPDIFGLSTLNLWQAIGLCLLCQFLFTTHIEKKD